MEPYRLEFTMPGLPKMTNAKRSFGHWAQYHKEATKWKQAVFPYLATRKPPRPLERAQLTLVRGSSQEPDYEGLVSGFKHVIDGLVEAGILADDKMSNIGAPNYEWELAERGKGYIRVLVEELR